MTSELHGTGQQEGAGAHSSFEVQERSGSHGAGGVRVDADVDVAPGGVDGAPSRFVQAAARRNVKVTANARCGVLISPRYLVAPT